MGRLYRELRSDGENKKASSSSSSSSLSDALLFATICFVGLPVDVHVKDGSVFSGIFHTASVHHDYGIVLKKARITKKGKANSNIANGALIETLVILSGDLVQLVAKGVLLPADDDAGNFAGTDADTVMDIRVPSEQCAENDVEKLIKSAFDTKRTEQIRSSLQKDNGFAQDFMPTNSGKDREGRKPQMKEASAAAVNGRQCGRDGLQGEKEDVKEKLEFHLEDSTIKVEGSSSSSDACFTQVKPIKEGQTTIAAELSSYEASCDPTSLPAKMAKQLFERPASADTSSCTVSLDVSTSTNRVVDVTLGSSHCSTETVPHISQSNKSSKESRLNPGAKIFSPSFMNPISATPAVQTVAGIGYVPNNSPVMPVPAAQPEVRLNPFGSHSSVPVKNLPYANLPAGTVGTATPFPQPIIGHVGSRPQPLRYAVQYPIQGGPGIVHPNSESVTVGRLGQLVYVHPVSSEIVPGVTALSSSLLARPLPAPHQVQFPKHQGAAAGQAMQLCVAPPLVATGQQPPYAMPCHIPILQQAFPSNRYIQDPGSNVSVNAKFL
ncbi:hypothetical protein TIFTF001_034738 [Ficus carica]|uniref:Ataxin 2 SM domain-containing protein n=1 Tax=Ficus carica TaxID=3494 RepID=A0AA88E3G3_FICCA|nr:hypothetical protein TIFTF001_034738 [Ficus carica]